jgi:phenylacetate-CoA ligase
MSFFEALDQFFVGRIAFPATNYFLNRKHILGRYRRLLRSEHDSIEALRELQLERLRAILQHAYRCNPFYTKRFMEIGLVPNDLKTLEDIRRIPPLDRQDIIDHRLDMVDFRYRHSVSDADKTSTQSGLPISFANFRRHRLIRRISSGSTGAPTIFYEDGSTTALNWVHELRLKQWYGLAPGVKEARMSATSTEYAARSKRPSAREWLWNQAILPGYFLSDREFALSLEKIREFRPRVLWGPTPALAGLAGYIQRENKDITGCRPDLVISRAAPLYAHEKSLLSEVFGCPVTNIYGTRELGHVGMNCPHGALHINQENYLVEIEDSGRNERNAGPGNILVTPLFESPMPFIRYRIGDLAEMGAQDCPCGRSLPVIRKILGRIGDVFKTTDGRLIEPNFWCIPFEMGRLSRDIERFQVIYKRNDCIRFRIVPRRSYSAETEADMRRFVDENLTSAMQVEFEYVPEIKPQPSGKFRFVVNEIDQQEEQPAHV